jgi:hypothetical protein
MNKVPHSRRVSNRVYYQQPDIVPTNLSASPPTPTPMNIDRLAPFYAQQSFLPIPTTATGSRKSKY